MCSLCVHDVMSCYQIKDCVCVHVRMCAHVHAICAHMRTHMCRCVYTRVQMYVHACACACVHALCSDNNFPFVYSAVPWPTLNTAGYVT